LALRVNGRLLAAGIPTLVQGDDLVGGLVEPLGTVQQLGLGAAVLLAGVGQQLDAVDGKHLAPDQARAVASE
jgi:hypothetical protein